MKGILILAHGSRRKETEQTLEEVANKVRAMTDSVLETAFLQFSDKSLEVGLDALKERGCDDIAVVPYFLFDGVHIKEDIPGEISGYLSKNPGLNVRFGKTLGADDALARLVAQRADEALHG